EEFVRARDLQVSFKFWPFLNRQVEVKKITLHSSAIRIVRNSSGEFNFSTLGGAKTKGQPEHAAGGKRQREPSERPSRIIFIPLVDIAGGDLRYIDRAHGADLRFHQMDLQVANADVNQPLSIKLAAALLDDKKQNIHVVGNIGRRPADGDWTATPIEGTLDIDHLDLTRLKDALPSFRSALPKGVDLAGIFQLKDVQFKGSLKGDLAVTGAIDGTEGVIKHGNTFNKPAGTPFTLSMQARYGDNHLAIDHALLKLHGLELVTRGDIRLDAGAALNLTVKSGPTSLHGWERFFPALEPYRLKGTMDLQATVSGKIGSSSMPQLHGTMTLKNGSAQPPDFAKAIENLDTTIKFTGQRADVRDMALSLGKSRIRLAAVVEKFAPLSISYKLMTQELWPADYQSSMGPERTADIIRNFQSEGQFTVAGDKLRSRNSVASASGTLFGIAYKDLRANLSLADKIAKVQSLRVQTLNGSIEAQGEFAFKENTPHFALTTKLDGVDVKELYAALDSQAERDIQGRLNAELNLSGSGPSWDVIKTNLRGQGEAEIVQGVIYNFNIAESALTGMTGVPGLTNSLSPSLRKKHPETFTSKDTAFKELRSLIDVADGQINFKNMRMSAAEFLAVGNGWVDFNRKVDSRATLTFSQRLSADLAQSAREIKYLLNHQGQLEIPFSVTGKMPNLKTKPDMNYLGQVVQRNFMGKGAEDSENNFLGRRDRAGESDGESLDSKRKRRRSTEERIRRGLENLFKR
ncbi:MAG TPA: AsmA-like C-terminal region-containing protein, partial [Candidatus Binatia bacterium]|nr:AsmA-like C-terminal region-containing protein [Candidatus Binatia bacterium]